MKPSPAKTCAAATRGFARLPAPTTLDDVAAGFRKAHDLQPVLAKIDRSGARNPDRESAYTKHGIAFLEALQSLSIALSDGDGPAADDAIAKAQSELTAMDRTRSKAKVAAACTSQAFGAAYLGEAAVVIKRVLAPTGNFVTDANAACARLNRKTQPFTLGTLGLGVGAGTVLNTSTIEDSLRIALTAYQAFALDLRAIPPSAGSEAQYSSLRQTVDQIVKKLDETNTAYGTASDQKVSKLGDQLVDLGAKEATAETALGLSC